jgi:hypothetical protein
MQGIGLYSHGVFKQPDYPAQFGYSISNELATYRDGQYDLTDSACVSI